MGFFARVLESLLERAAPAYEQWRDRKLKASLHHCGAGVKLYHPLVFYGPEALDIGDHTAVAPFVHIWCGGRVVIGARCMIGSHVAISSLTHDHTQPKMFGTMVARPVAIGDDVWIGAHAVILPGVTLGDGCVVGAGAVVTRDVPPRAIVYGVPARIHGYRAGAEAAVPARETA
jgi:acetyltransferase-like isoleucine patch superfamily enzyme